jgi:uncharacterized membrane protein (UPF0127 family)
VKEPSHEVYCARTGHILIPEVEILEGAIDRFRGLIGRAGLPRGQAVFLPNCPAVHTFFMRFALDLVFLSRDRRVVRVVRHVRPTRMVFGGRGADAVLEMQAGWLSADPPTEGDRLAIRRRAAESPGSPRPQSR